MTYLNYRNLFAVCISLLGLLFFSVPAFSQPAQTASVVTKGAFVERYFLNQFTRPPAARRYVPVGAENLPPADRYQAVVKGLAEKGVMVLTGTKPEQPLSRVEFITLTFLLAGGEPAISLAAKKEMLKGRGVIDPNDIGFVKAFQGDVTVRRLGEKEGVRVTGVEPVFFKDFDETELGARVVLQFDDGSTLAIGEDSSVQIDEMIYDPKTAKRSFKLRLTVGKILVNAVKNTNPDSKFLIITPTLLAAIRGTVVGFDVDNRGTSSVITKEGNVAVCLGEPDNCLPPDPSGRSKPGENRGVIVGTGQTTTAVPGNPVLTVVTASPEVIQTIVNDTTVIAPTTVASVSTTDTQKTDNVVQVEINEPTASTVDSQIDTSQQTSTAPVADDKGTATDEVTTTGIASGLTTENTPLPALIEFLLEQQLAGLTGQALIDFFNSLSPADQIAALTFITNDQAITLAPLLTIAQVNALLGGQVSAILAALAGGDLTTFAGKLSATQVAGLSGLEVSALLGVLAGGDLTAFVGKLDGPQVAALSNADAIAVAPLLTIAQVNALTGGQVTAILAGLAGGDLTAFVGKLSPTQVAALSTGDAIAVAPLLTPVQAEAAVVNLVPADAVVFYNALDVAAQEAVQDNFNAAQFNALVTANTDETPGGIKTFLLTLTAAGQAHNFGFLTAANQIALAALLTQVETEALLANLQPGVGDPAALNSLDNFVNSLSAAQLGKSIDNLNVAQVTALVFATIDECDGGNGPCAPEWLTGDPVIDGSLSLTPFGEAIAQALREEIRTNLGFNPAGTGFTWVARMIVRTLETLDPLDPNIVRDINDIFGGGMLLANYSVNGGVQMAQFLQNPNGAGAGQLMDFSDYIAERQLDTDGFLAYVEQVADDHRNVGLLIMADSASHQDLTNQLLNQAATIKSMSNLVVSQLELSDLRARDARLESQADARAGLRVRDHTGNSVRISQYVYRHPAIAGRGEEIQLLNISSRSGLYSYLDFRTIFAAGSLGGLTSPQIRDLPWNDYLTTLYSGPATGTGNCQDTPTCNTMVGSPAGSPMLVAMSVQHGSSGTRVDINSVTQSGFFLRYTREFGQTRGTHSGFNYAGSLVSSTFEHQEVTQETVTTRGVSSSALHLVTGSATVGDGIIPIANDPRAGSSLSINAIPTGEFRNIPRLYGSNLPFIVANPTSFPLETQNPEGYIVRSIGAYDDQFTGTKTGFHNFESFRALGDSNVSVSGDPTANVITGLSGVKINNIWDALRVGMPGVSLSGAGQNLPVIDIGGNLLQFRRYGIIYLPWNRMIWRDGAGNWPTFP